MEHHEHIPRTDGLFRLYSIDLVNELASDSGLARHFITKVED